MSESIHADVSNTLRISTRRFEQSPFIDCYANEHTVYGVYAGRYYSVYNGEDTSEAYWALRRRVVLYDVPERPVEIRGPDVVAFLEHLFARRVGDLREGRGRYCIACTPWGGLFMDGVLFRLAADRFWYVQPDGPLESWLAAHAGGYDVTVVDPHSRVLQIQGPNAPAVLAAASDGAVGEGMGYFHAGFFELGGQSVYVSRTGWTGELGFEVYTQGAATDCTRLWEHLVDAGRPHGMIFSSVGSMGIRRIEAGILDNGSDFDHTMTPWQAGLGAFVDLDKPEFVGRTALVDADRRPLLFGVRCECASAPLRAAVRDGDEVVGQVTAGAWSPFLGCGIGYVRFERAGEWPGKKLTVATAEGTATGTVVELPFYDREKRIPRGLDRAIP